jgi:hypothetical protein
LESTTITARALCSDLVHTAIQLRRKDALVVVVDALLFATQALRASRVSSHSTPPSPWLLDFLEEQLATLNDSTDRQLLLQIVSLLPGDLLLLNDGSSRVSLEHLERLNHVLGVNWSEISIFITPEKLLSGVLDALAASCSASQEAVSTFSVRRCLLSR